MKRISTFLFASTLAIASLSSCSSDDNSSVPQPQPQPTNVLLGKWEMQKMDMKMEMGGNVLIDQQDVDTKTAGIKIEYDFKADNTVEYYMYTPATQQQAEQEQSGTATYTRNGDEITMTINNPTTYTIKVLNSTELHLNMYQEEEVNGSQTKIDITQKFTKM